MIMIRLPKDFKEFLQLLNDHHVEYLLVGGYAVGYHGYPRATVDLDIWVAASPPNAMRIVKVFREFGFDVNELNEDLFLKENKIIRIGEPPLRIEVMTSVSGVECFSVGAAPSRDGIVAGSHPHKGDTSLPLLKPLHRPDHFCVG